MRAEIIVSGIVQGVGFRPFIYRVAKKSSLLGYVRNLGDARVEIVVEGSERAIKQFISDLKKDKPAISRIHDLKIRYSEAQGEFADFTILKSTVEGSLAGSTIPADIGICDECLTELRNAKDRRHNYFFITCTNCGPRYTIIEKLPYDRPNTTMKDFPMCERCKQEYINPLDRRFHAQTIACSVCGPKVYLTERSGKTLNSKDPIREAGRLLADGLVIAVKGNGGFHLATSTTKDRSIIKLREIKHRSQKPFAIMARDLQTAKTFSKITTEEEEALKSVTKPIVLLEKSRDYYLSELIAPGLDNIGVMLPYTGLHVMLFDGHKEPAFVMTSANASDEPITIDNQEALKNLSSVADYFLMHDRVIAQRADDSVIKIIDGKTKFIRRSKGYAPVPIRLPKKVKESVLALGAEMNVTACVIEGENAFLSQHIGDVGTHETLQFLKDATEHLLKLTNCKPQTIACDLHPKYNTTTLAREMGEKLAISVRPVQHHHAHAAALMAEHGLDEVIGIICDGVGYGLNGEIWGGEVLYCSTEGFERLGHIQSQPMVGGDLATNHPVRMVVGILHKDKVVQEWLMDNSNFLPHGKAEAELILKQLRAGKFLWSSSCGRVLDAVSALLGICHERTYEGEPAMKLESVAKQGQDALKLEPKIRNNILDTTYLLQEIFENRLKLSVYNLAYSAQNYLAKGLAKIAVDNAQSLGVKTIGFSGGVAYNGHMTLTIKKAIEDAGLAFVAHDNVPPGDGGTSFGQAVAIGLTDKLI